MGESFDIVAEQVRYSDAVERAVEALESIAESLQKISAQVDED